MSRQKEVFRPRADQGNRVSMYVCGVTVYDYSHIGRWPPLIRAGCAELCCSLQGAGWHCTRWCMSRVRCCNICAALRLQL